MQFNFRQKSAIIHEEQALSGIYAYKIKGTRSLRTDLSVIGLHDSDIVLVVKLHPLHLIANPYTGRLRYVMDYDIKPYINANPIERIPIKQFNDANFYHNGYDYIIHLIK